MADNMFSQRPMSTYQGFGINPAYTTPAYMSNFRPAYSSDTDPNNPYAINRGYMDAMRQQYMFQNTFGNYASDPSQDERANNWSLNTMNSDAAMEGVTKFGVPLAAWYGANKFFGQRVAARSPTAGLFDRSSAYARSIYRGEGMAAAASAWGSTAATQSLGGALGASAGRMTGSLVGNMIGAVGRAFGLGGALAGTGGVLGATGAVVGGLVGAIGAPLLAGAAIGKAANYYISEPYVGIRRGEDAMLSNTANQYVGGVSSPNVGTFGMSARHANSLSRAFTESNTRDLGFQQGDYAAMADYGMQAGIFNDIGNMNVDQMKKRVEGMADSVKMIMAVANTTSVKEAIQYMGRLKAAGVSNPAAVTRVMSEMGIASGISGASAEQIMNTVGNQGQMVAQQLGMLPVMGQRQAATIFAGFSNAYKTGAIHSADIAALGGVEGATQNLLEGSGQIMNSPYFRAAINSGGQLGTGNMLNVSGAFGAHRAGNPLRSFGLDQINFGANASEYLNKHSMTDTVLSTLYDRSRGTPAAMMQDGSGKVDLVAALGLAMAQGQLTPEQARAFGLDVQGKMDPQYQARLRDATAASTDKQYSQYRSQMGYDTLAGTPFGGMINTGREINRNLMSGSGAVAGAFTRIRAGMADDWDSFNARIQGRVRVQDRSVENYKMVDGVQTLQTTETFSQNSAGFRLTQYDDVMKQIGRDSATVDPKSELGQVIRQLKGNFGKSDTDNRALLDRYYRLKKGDVGRDMSRGAYTEWTNEAIRTGVSKVTNQTADDLNPRVSDDFLQGYAESNVGKLRGAKGYGKSAAYKTDSFADKYFGSAGMERFVKGQFGKGDGARIFNAAIRSQTATGRTDLGDLFDAGGDGKTSFYTKEFGELLSRFKSDPSSLTEEERGRVRDYMALQKISGLGSDVTGVIDKGILALGSGDESGAGVLFGKQGDAYRAAVAKNVNAGLDKMDVSTYRKGVKQAQTAAGYTGTALNALDGISDSAIRNMTGDQRADSLRKGGEVTKAAQDTIDQATKEAQHLSSMYGGVDAIKSMGAVADNIGKATDGLTASSDALNRAADALEKISGSGDPALAKAVNSLNQTLAPLVRAAAPGSQTGGTPRTTPLYRTQ